MSFDDKILHNYENRFSGNRDLAVPLCTCYSLKSLTTIWTRSTPKLAGGPNGLPHACFRHLPVAKKKTETVYEWLVRQQLPVRTS